METARRVGCRIGLDTAPALTTHGWSVAQVFACGDGTNQGPDVRLGARETQVVYGGGCWL
jgi:hypothetical protein